MPRSAHPILPPFAPGALVRLTPTTRSPPALDHELSQRQQVEYLVNAYRGAYAARFDHPSMIFANTDVRESKHWTALVEGAQAMLDHNISVGGWALWSFDVWASGQDRASSRPQPPITYVFGARRIEEKRGWFRSFHGSYLGGRCWRLETQREYIAQWKKLAAHLSRLPYDEAEDANVQRELTDLYFPNGWRAYVGKAQQEAQEMQDVLDRAIARFDYTVL